MSMKSRHYALLAAAMAVPGLALATPEKEANNPIAFGQVVEISAGSGTTGGAVLDAIIGVVTGTAVLDTDYFVFEGREGDVVTLDIDGGMGGGRDVDTILAVFGPAPAYAMLRTNDDGGSPVDSGSTSPLDARIVNFRLPASGAYTVGVSSYPRRFANGGGTTTNSLGSRSNGDYALLISGVTVPVLQINIDIKPGSGDVAPINPKARGKIPVALLGSSAFSVEEIDTSALGFGHSGDEASLSKCGSPSDLNGDAFPDLVCHFENQAAAWDGTEDEAMLKGKLRSGLRFEGRGWLKVVPVKADQN